MCSRSASGQLTASVGELVLLADLHALLVALHQLLQVLLVEVQRWHLQVELPQDPLVAAQLLRLLLERLVTRGDLGACQLLHEEDALASHAVSGGQEVEVYVLVFARAERRVHHDHVCWLEGGCRGQHVAVDCAVGFALDWGFWLTRDYRSWPAARRPRLVQAPRESLWGLQAGLLLRR